MKREDDFREEIESHVQMRAQLNREAGLPEDQARESATRMAAEVLCNPIIEDYRVEIEA